MLPPFIKKAVFPVAGLGTRFLPATKANPKEMLPIVDKPLIQYAVDEAIEAGVSEIIFVTSSSKRAIEDHFDFNFELESKLQEQQKYDLLEVVHSILPKHVTCGYVRQPIALGLGHAILCAEPLVGSEPFAVLLADDLIESSRKGCLSQLVDAFQLTQKSVIAIQTIASSETQKYGVIATGHPEGKEERLVPLNGIVEKPEPSEAPSLLGVIGRYILMPSIFQMLRMTQKGKGGEIQLTDAIAQLLLKEACYGYRYEGRRFDCGTKLGYLQATVEYALCHPELSEDFYRYLQSKFL